MKISGSSLLISLYSLGGSIIGFYGLWQLKLSLGIFLSIVEFCIIFLILAYPDIILHIIKKLSLELYDGNLIDEAVLSGVTFIIISLVITLALYYLYPCPPDVLSAAGTYACLLGLMIAVQMGYRGIKQNPKILQDLYSKSIKYFFDVYLKFIDAIIYGMIFMVGLVWVTFIVAPTEWGFWEILGMIHFVLGYVIFIFARIYAFGFYMAEIFNTRNFFE